MFTTRLFSAFASQLKKADAGDSIPTEWAATHSGPCDPPREGDLCHPVNGTPPAYDATMPMGLPAA